MNCQSFESIVNELARRQMMEANVREQALAHTAECGVCALRLADERALTQKLSALTEDMNAMEAPPRIEGELLAAFRKQKFAEQSPKRRRSAVYDWRYWTTAAAAVLLIVIGMAALSMRSRQPQRAAAGPYIPPIRPAFATNNNKPGPPEFVIPEPGALPKPENTVANYNPRRRPNSSVRSRFVGSHRERTGVAAESESTVAANYSENEIATDFLPIGYSNPMNLQDGGQLMRVELPRSALAGFGLPVNMERVNERVKADVLVSPDGQARAIRFVQ